MKRIFAIRPEPGLTATQATGRQMGLAIEAWPLFEIRPLPWLPPGSEDVDALLIGSANALRQAGEAIAGFRDKPVYAVGEATARAARAAGLSVAAVGAGGLQNLLDEIGARNLRLLRLAGAERVTLMAPSGIRLIEREVYENAPLEMPAEFAEDLAHGGIVLLHSAAAAEYFRKECVRLGVERGRIALAALSGRIAQAAGTRWKEVRYAELLTEHALLALAKDMCH